MRLLHRVIGQENNIVYQLGKLYDTFDTAEDSFRNAILTMSNSNQVPVELSNILHTLIDSITVGKTDQLTEYDGALGNFLQEEFEKLRKVQGNDIDVALASQFLQLYEKHNCGTNFFDSTLDVSAKGMADQWKCKGERFLYFKGSKGFEKLFQLLTQKNNINLEGKLLFHKKVISIDYSEQEVGKARVHCSDGTIVSADHVIITLPLGVLKER